MFGTRRCLSSCFLILDNEIKLFIFRNIYLNNFILIQNYFTLVVWIITIFWNWTYFTNYFIEFINLNWQASWDFCLSFNYWRLLENVMVDLNWGDVFYNNLIKILFYRLLRWNPRTTWPHHNWSDGILLLLFYIIFNCKLQI